MVAYYKQMAAKLGMDPPAAPRAPRWRYGDAMKEIAAKMKDMKGYPVRSALTIQLAGAVLTPEQQAELERRRPRAAGRGGRKKKKGRGEGCRSPGQRGPVARER